MAANFHKEAFEEAMGHGKKKIRNNSEDIGSITCSCSNNFELVIAVAVAIFGIGFWSCICCCCGTIDRGSSAYKSCECGFIVPEKVF